MAIARPIKALANYQGSVRLSRFPKYGPSVDAKSRGRGTRRFARSSSRWASPRHRRPGGFVLYGQINVGPGSSQTDYQRLQRDWKDYAQARRSQNWSGEIERVTPKLEIVGSGSGLVRGAVLAHHPRRRGVSETPRSSVLLRSGQSQTRLKEWPHRFDRHCGPGRISSRSIRELAIPAQTQPGLYYRINRAPRRVCGRDPPRRALAPPSPIAAEALKRFITGRDASPDVKMKLGRLTETLREYQLAGFEWLTRPRCEQSRRQFLADREWVLVKPVADARRFFFLRAHQGDGPALVVCPTSLVTKPGRMKRGGLPPELKTLVLEGADSGPAPFSNSIGRPSNIVITSLTGAAAARQSTHSARKSTFSTAVLDEAQHIKKSGKTQKTAPSRPTPSAQPIALC